MRTVVLCLVLTSVGCTGAKYAASMKTSSGGAMAKPGVGAGRTNVVRIADSSGPLSRAGLYALALLTAAGAYKETSRETNIYKTDTTTTIVTTTTGYVDPATLAAAQDLADAATGNDPIGLQASLEIASRDFGGDTSGWMYNLGYTTEPFHCGPHLACRFYGGVGVGRYTFHDREIGGPDAMTVGESEYNYFGIPLRLEIVPIPYVSAFVQADLNIATAANHMSGDVGSPSPWHAGVELRFKILVARVSQSWARMSSADRSTNFEVGLGF